jgi:hypothetical protein
LLKLVYCGLEQDTTRKYGFDASLRAGKSVTVVVQGPQSLWLDFNYENVSEKFNGILRAFNNQGCLLEELSSQLPFKLFICILFFNAENDICTVSCSDASEKPVQVKWE